MADECNDRAGDDAGIEARLDVPLDAGIEGAIDPAAKRDTGAPGETTAAPKTGPTAESPEIVTHKSVADEFLSRDHAKPVRDRQPKSERSEADPKPIDFGVPTLRHFASYTRVPQMLEGYVCNALREDRRLDHMLIHGRAGSGTTVLARALANDYAPARIDELDPLAGLTTPRLRRALARCNRRGVVLIRHIELLDHEQMHIVADYMSGKAFDRTSRTEGPAGPMRAPWETDLDREIAASARDRGDAEQARGTSPGGTIIGTALMMGRMPYLLRSRFEQLIHLRNDPKAMRAALIRVLGRCGVTIEPATFARVERVLGTLTESTEHLARTVLARAGFEGTDRIGDALMQSIIEEDLPSRVPDVYYASSLRDHLAGRKVKCASDEEVERLAAETGWGRAATRAAIATMIRENRARKCKEMPQSPM